MHFNAVQVCVCGEGVCAHGELVTIVLIIVLIMMKTFSLYCIIFFLTFIFLVNGTARRQLHYRAALNKYNKK